jgi:predicted nucleic acid-binding protein
MLDASVLIGLLDTADAHHERAVNDAIAEGAAELRAAHDSLRLSDAIVLATGRELRAHLLTYDDNLGKGMSAWFVG